jgi:(p)ppGpp synthase/HD superfamily hydrolase
MNSNPAEAISRKEKITDELAAFQNKVTEKFTPADSAQIMAALDFMLKIHLPQADRVDGKPFASHPLAVAEKVMELSDNPELVIAALIHDSVEDQPDHIFIERVNKKYPERPFTYLPMDENSKEKYKDTFRDWSFREIQDRFGDQVKYYVENMTNHDYNSLVEDSGLQGEAKQDLINKLYAEHVENIINDPELFTLKLADLLVNIDLHSLDPESAKYHKLRRKYKSVIEALLQKLDKIDSSHPIYNKRDEIKDELTQIYNEQYNK